LQRGNSLSSIKKSSPSQTSTVSFPTSSVPITKKAKSHLHKVHKTSDHRVSRKKRAAAVDPEASVVQKYDLTDKNIVSRLQLTEEQVKSCQKSVNNLKKAISRYGGLRNKNSRVGQRLLVDQSRFMED
ncbi:tcdB toxin N-terminal helical domain protein, partial [Chlamydia psittaci 84-8471/1]